MEGNLHVLQNQLHPMQYDACNYFWLQICMQTSIMIRTIISYTCRACYIKSARNTLTYVAHTFHLHAGHDYNLQN